MKHTDRSGRRLMVAWPWALVLAVALGSCSDGPPNDTGLPPESAQSVDGQHEGAPGFSHPILVRAAELASADAVLARALEPTDRGWELRGARLISPGWAQSPSRRPGTLAARLASRADGPLELWPRRNERHSVTLWLEDAQPIAADVERGAAFFSSALPDTALIVTTSDVRVEQLLLLRGPEAPRSFAWRIAHGANVAGAAPLAGGGLRFHNASGEAVLRIPPPYAVDAQGVRRDAELTYEDHRLRLAIDLDGLTYPVLLDPAFEVPLWENRSAADPGARGMHCMTYADNLGATVLFGGSTTNNEAQSVNETWEWNGTGWTERCTSSPCNTDLPVPRSHCGLAFDDQRNVAVLFGGYDFINSMQDTWEWNGSSWSERCTTAPCTNDMPTPRHGHALAFDTQRNVTVLFGGYDAGASSHRQDIWEWNGTSWTERCTSSPCNDPGNRPDARWRARMAFDSDRNVAVVFGGQDSSWTYRQDIWEWNGTSWTERCTSSPCNDSGNRPGTRRSPGMAFDSRRNRTVLYGGQNGTTRWHDTWEWDGTAWTEMVPTSVGGRNDLDLAFDSTRGRIVRYGGLQGASSPVAETHEYHTRGSACGTGSDCDTGYCVDDVCCEVASCGTCERCDAGDATTGTCTAVVNGPDDTCSTTHTCDATGQCKKLLGQSCAVGTECLSTICADGRCCENGCTTPCRSCANAQGTCTTVVASQQDDYCGGTNACDAAGVCRLAPGQICSSPTECSSGYCVDGRCCVDGCTTPCRSCENGAGTCTTLVTSEEDDYCSGVQSCDASGACTGSLGYPCSGAGECVSGYCVDGVCCEQSCAQLCEACDEVGSEGKCVAILGAPHGDRGGCSTLHPVCGGACNGSDRSACDYPGATVSCGSLCVEGARTPRSCDGAGACVDGDTTPCAPYQCDAAGEICRDSCSATEHCASGYACNTSTSQCVGETDTCEDEVTVLHPDGARTECSPFRCLNGECLSRCTSVSDCAVGYICTSDGACEPPNSESPTEDASCSCHTPGGRGPRPAPGLLVMLALGLLISGRRRSRWPSEAPLNAVD